MDLTTPKCKAFFFESCTEYAESFFFFFFFNYWVNDTQEGEWMKDSCITSARH